MSASIITRLRNVGRIEGVSFLLLLFVAMPLKYLAGQPMAVKIVGWIHGLLFMWFLFVLLQARQSGLPDRMTVIALIAALLPFGPFVVDRRLQEFERA